MTNNRVDEILNQVGLQIISRRLSGNFPPGYESSVEREHDLQLGKVREAQIDVAERLTYLIGSLREAMNNLDETPRDSSRFRLVRVIRETFGIRHDLRSTKKNVIAINHQIDEMLTEIATTIAALPIARDQLIAQLSYQVIERTMLIDQLVVLCRDMEVRVSTLEQSS